MNNLLKSNTETPYSEAFYVHHGDRSYQSADCVLPLVLSIVPAKSAIDVGCGIGTWTCKLLECGVTDVLGIDGDYVNLELLRIPRDRFRAWDLSKPFTIDRRFELAVCMEVAEHLPEARAEGLVGDLVRLAPVVLFSAAIPGQGGTGHINEQYLSYWVNHFAARDYVLLDFIRPSLWNDERCDWWYRQNVVLFAHKDDPISRLKVRSGIDYVHPQIYESMLRALDRPNLSYLLKAFPGSLIRSVRTRLLGSGRSKGK